MKLLLRPDCFRGSIGAWEVFAVLFRKDMEASCAYCRHGAKIDDDTVLCSRKGLRGCNEPCLRFSYDPLKRVPEPLSCIELSSFSDEDFSL